MYDLEAAAIRYGTFLGRTVTLDVRRRSPGDDRSMPCLVVLIQAS